MFYTVESLGVVDRNVLRRANLSFFRRAVTALSQSGLSTWTWEKSPGKKGVRMGSWGAGRWQQHLRGPSEEHGSNMQPRFKAMKRKTLFLGMQGEVPYSRKPLERG